MSMAREPTAGTGLRRAPWIATVVAALAYPGTAAALATSSATTSATTAASPAGPGTEATPSTPDGSPSENGTPELRLAEGRALYSTRCAVCHGKEGDGRGPAARFMKPRPRDLARGVFRFRSTPSGELPTDADLHRTLERGIRGTPMPSWSGLSRVQRESLVQFVKSLSPRFQEETPARAVPIPEPPPETPEGIARGAGIYEALECHKCHGADGRGDGPSSETLLDDQGDPIVPFDMTRPKKLKGGAEARDLYRTLMTGLDGTPMPAYEGVLTDDEVWDLVQFLRSLFRR